MYSIKNARGRKVCRIDPTYRTVEIVNRNLKVVLAFLNDGRTEITLFDADGLIFSTDYLNSIA